MLYSHGTRTELEDKNRNENAVGTPVVNENDSDDDGGIPQLRSPKSIADTFSYPNPNPNPNPDQDIPSILEQGGLHRVPWANCASLTCFAYNPNQHMSRSR